MTSAKEQLEPYRQQLETEMKEIIFVWAIGRIIEKANMARVHECEHHFCYISFIFSSTKISLRTKTNITSEQTPSKCNSIKKVA